MKHILLATILFAETAAAQSPMTGVEFEAYVQGKTLYYAADESRYGVEEYLPRRRVRWSFLDGHCKEGRWYEQANQICFVYEDNFEPQCWSFFLGSDGLTAQFENESGGQTLYEIANSGEEMLCLGPEIGV
ncbi:hypothetical protein [Pseudopelagicola sp. nBUS_19]|uniref:hypothetical protein n=1 Tax=unclassified Pseudopelagicola TaxID=2649563 RepID=UPI003EC05A0B